METAPYQFTPQTCPKCEYVEEYYGHRCKHCGMFHAHGNAPWDDFDDEDDDDQYGNCEVCGGEFWDGGTSCICDDED